MSQVSQDHIHSFPTLMSALAKLKKVRAEVGTRGDEPVLGELTAADIDTVIDHCEATKGHFQMPDLPM